MRVRAALNAHCKKTLLLVCNRQVSKVSLHHLEMALLNRYFSAIILRSGTNCGRVVELFDLSALTPSDRESVAKIVKEHTGKDI